MIIAINEEVGIINALFDKIIKKSAAENQKLNPEKVNKKDEMKYYKILFKINEQSSIHIFQSERELSPDEIKERLLDWVKNNLRLSINKIEETTEDDYKSYLPIP